LTSKQRTILVSREISLMFTKKRRQIPTWELVMIAAAIAAATVRGTPGLVLAIGIVAIVGVYLIWTKL
jgi:hypothetical protein